MKELAESAFLLALGACFVLALVAGCIVPYGPHPHHAYPRTSFGHHRHEPGLVRTIPVPVFVEVKPSQNPQ